MKKMHLVFIVLASLLVTAALAAAQNQGQKTHTLFGGKSGDVTLPHHLHQAVLDDCMVCHKDFSQETGALMAAKKAGTLKKKQVMNNTCLKCHRSMKKAGKETGPTSCKDCHIK